MQTIERSQPSILAVIMGRKSDDGEEFVSSKAKKAAFQILTGSIKEGWYAKHTFGQLD